MIYMPPWNSGNREDTVDLLADISSAVQVEYDLLTELLSRKEIFQLEPEPYIYLYFSPEKKVKVNIEFQPEEPI